MTTWICPSCDHTVEDIPAEKPSCIKCGTPMEAHVVLHCDTPGCRNTTTWVKILDDPVGSIKCDRCKL